MPAPGVALEFIFQNHDAKIKLQQRLLAVVLTMRMDHDWQPAILSLDR